MTPQQTMNIIIAALQSAKDAFDEFDSSNDENKNCKTVQRHCFFPIVWSSNGNRQDGIGGPPVDDPSVIFVQLNRDARDYDDDCCWISLDEAVDDLIDGHISGGDEKIIKDADGIRIVSIVRDRLRLLADKIDSQIKKGTIS